MRKAMTVFIGFVHDLAFGSWGATVLAVFFVTHQQTGPELAPVLSALAQRFFWIGVGCAVVVLATGAGRGLTYVENFYGEEAEASRRRMLIWKHVVLFVVFGVGLWWQYGMAFR